jgi:hypothetical protein
MQTGKNQGRGFMSEEAAKLDMDQRNTIIQLIRRGEPVERIAGICHVSPAVIERILDQLCA